MKKRLFSILLALPCADYGICRERDGRTACMHLRNSLHGRSNERRLSHLRRRGRFAGELCKVRPARRRCGSAAGGGSV